jgi:spermidine synthase
MLELTTFIAGAAIMAIEIVASRILAPVLGNSIVVWSSLIGVILAALSYGYLKGGVLADRNASTGQLSLIIASAALLTAFVAVGKNVCLMASSRIPDIRAAAIMAELVLFAPVSFVLAMVSPYVARLKLKEVGSTGATVGRLYAISTIGSIVGTFSAGFYLLSMIGSTAILFCISGLLLSCSILLSTTRFLKLKIAAAGIVALCAYGAPSTSTPFISGKHVFESDTHYNHCLVYEGADVQTGRPSRALLTDRFARQSAVFTDGKDDLVLEYLKYFRFGAHFCPDAQRALLLGGGGFTYVADFFRRNPTKSLDVVELDPELVRIAKQYFGLRPNPRLRIFTEDARVYLNRSQTVYDIIYFDTFSSAAIVPHYLTTRETAHLVYDSLSSNGVAVLNVMSAVYGPRGRFLRAELATYRSVFPRVEIFKLSDEADTIGNVVMVAFKNPAEPTWTSDEPDLAARLSRRWIRPIQMDVPALTDDYSPVEVYMMRWFF